MVHNLKIRLAVTSLAAGFIYYVCWRWLQLPVIDPSAGSFPSFIFVFAFGLLQPTLPSKLQAPYHSHWLLLVLVTEPLFGTMAWLDVLAAFLGYISAQVAQKYLPQSDASAPQPNMLLLILAPALLMGSYIPPEDSPKPVYMSYEQLRKSVAFQEAQPMTAMGRLVVYQDYLFINELNKGIHIINNANPKEPQATGFINIPGNTDISIRNGILYADSFIDLVVIDTRDPKNMLNVTRKTNVFPWNQYQAVGTGEWFDADEKHGVVIALEKR